jgi:hypothetical protein
MFFSFFFHAWNKNKDVVEAKLEKVQRTFKDKLLQKSLKNFCFFFHFSPIKFDTQKLIKLTVMRTFCFKLSPKLKPYEKLIIVPLQLPFSWYYQMLKMCLRREGKVNEIMQRRVGMWMYEKSLLEYWKIYP